MFWVPSFLLLTAPAMGQEMWHGVRAGITVAELGALPGTRLSPVTAPSGDESGGVRKYNEYAAFTATESFCGEAFDVRFLISKEGSTSGRLSRIVIDQPNDPANRRTGANAIDFDCVLAQYAATYGPPLLTKRASGTGWAQDKYTFSKAETIIVVIVETGTIPRVTITYSLRAKGL